MAHSAIILYAPTRSHGRGQEKGCVATVHKILEARGQQVLGPGTPVSKRSVKAALTALGEQSEGGLSFLAGEVLARNDQQVVWWEPPKLKRMWFNTKECLGQRTGSAWQPGLVFAYCVNGGLKVWAVRGKKRPTVATKLYQAPYHNVWEDGQVCTGSMVLPKRIDEGTQATVTNSFFGSNFTHANVKNPKRLTRSGEGLDVLWSDRLSRPDERFPNMELVSARMVLGKALQDLGES